MKRVAIAAVLVVAMVFGVIAYASAENVTVNATINQKISLSINDGAVVWNATPGTAALPSTEIFTVKSNKPWKFTLDPVTYLPADGLLDAVLSESHTGDFAPGDVGIGAGVKTMNATYSLNMMSDASYDLDPAVAYSATYLYTAAQ